MELLGSALFGMRRPAALVTFDPMPRRDHMKIAKILTGWLVATRKPPTWSNEKSYSLNENRLSASNLGTAAPGISYNHCGRGASHV
jgi:hypothetical protein